MAALEPELLSVRETAERLHCSESFIRRLLKSRQLGHVRLGTRNIRISEANIDAYLRRQEQAALSHYLEARNRAS